MTFQVAIDSVCPGGNHIHVTATIGGRTLKMVLSREDLTGDPGTDRDRESIKRRIVSAVKELAIQNGGLAALRTGLQGKDFII